MKRGEKGNDSMVWLLSLVGVAMCLSGFFWRRAELSKPEAERDKRVVAASTALLVIGGIVLFFWGFFLATVGTDLITLTRWT